MSNAMPQPQDFSATNKPYGQQPTPLPTTILVTDVTEPVQTDTKPAG